MWLFWLDGVKSRFYEWRQRPLGIRKLDEDDKRGALLYVFVIVRATSLLPVQDETLQVPDLASERLFLDFGPGGL